MERVRKTFFNPLATSKAQVREILQKLPVGSAHPFSPEQNLLCRTKDGIDEIAISYYPENFFFNAVDLGEMGEVLVRRMTRFSSHLSMSLFSIRSSTNNVQEYSRTSRSCKPQHQHSRSLSSQIRSRCWPSLSENPLTTTSALATNQAKHAAGMQSVPSPE